MGAESGIWFKCTEATAKCRKMELGARLNLDAVSLVLTTGAKYADTRSSCVAFS